MSNNSKEVADGLSVFFSSVAQLNSNYTLIPTVIPLQRRVLSSMLLAPVCEAEVARVIQNLAPKTSEDINGVSTWLLKQCYESILSPLTKIVNFSFESGMFPSELKKAKVVPIFKKGDPTVANNYRPISILPAPSKVLEKIFAIRLLDFLEKHNILTDDQFGFRPGKSTIDAVTKLLDLVLEGLEAGKQTLSVFLDLSKAFDCVNHDILLNKLERCGVRGIPLAWIKSYLRGRSQCVQIFNSLSENVTIRQGVPQGSILGPLLFLIYVNEIGSSITNGRVIQYADDTTLCFKAESNPALEIEVFTNLSSCIQQFENDCLVTNHSKTNYIHFSLQNREQLSKPSVMIDNTILDEAKAVNFLGIHLDRGLTWNHHIDSVCAKVASGVFALRNISTFCTPKIQLMAYYGLIYPHITYGIRLWGSCSLVNLQRVFRLQKKAVRIISKLKSRESCKQAFRDLSLLTLPCLYILETVLYCRSKCTLTQGSDIHQYETRARNTYRVARHRTTAFERLPSQAGVRLINALPEELKNEPNHNKFKARLKGYLVAFAFYSVDEYFAHHL